jgi:hypothetical protein
LWESLLSGWRDILRAGAISGLWLVVYGAGTFEPIAVFAQVPLLHLGLVIMAGLGIFFAAIRYESSYLAAFASLGVLESCFLQAGLFASTTVTVTAAGMRLRYALSRENYWNRISLLLATVAFGQLATVQLWNLNSYEQVVNATLTGIALMVYGASYYLPMVRQPSDRQA